MSKENLQQNNIIPFNREQSDAPSIPEARVSLDNDYPGIRREDRIAAIRNSRRAYFANKQREKEDRERFVARAESPTNTYSNQTELPKEAVIIDLNEAKEKREQRRRNAQFT